MERWNKCKDCGQERDKEPGEPRQDVCKDCSDLRGRMVEARMTGKVSDDDFKKYQSALRGRSYRGKEIGLSLLKGA